MTPTQLKAARKRLGLSQEGLAVALRMGANGGRHVRRWELGETPISGPASVAIELLMGTIAGTQDKKTAEKSGKASD